MTFLALDMQANSMIMQKSQLEFQQMVNSSNLQFITQSLSNLAATNPKGLESDAGKSLQYDQQSFEQVQASLETQLKALNAMIESFQKTRDNSIKSECKLSLVG